MVDRFLYFVQKVTNNGGVDKERENPNNYRNDNRAADNSAEAYENTFDEAHLIEPPPVPIHVFEQILQQLFLGTALLVFFYASDCVFDRIL